MKEKFLNLIKKKNFIIACSVLLLTVITMKVSFSYLFSVKPSKNDEVVQVGPLEVTYGRSGNLIAKKNVNSMSDEEGLAQKEVGIINIQNTGKEYANYDLTVSNDITNFKNRGGYQSTDNLIPLANLKIAVYKYANSESTLIVEPVLINSLPKSQENNRYIVLSGKLGPVSNTNVTYQIKVWPSEYETPKEGDTYIFVNSEINLK